MLFLMLFLLLLLPRSGIFDMRRRMKNIHCRSLHLPPKVPLLKNDNGEPLGSPETNSRVPHFWACPVWMAPFGSGESGKRGGAEGGEIFGFPVLWLWGQRKVVFRPNQKVETKNQ